MRAALAIAALLTIIAPEAHAAVQQLPAGRRVDLRPEYAAGTAQTRLALAQVVLEQSADRGRVPVTLGEIVAQADTTLNHPLSLLKLTGVQADDKRAVEWERSNTSPDAIGYKDGPDLKGAGVKAQVELGGWGATSTGREIAEARLGVLEGTLDSNKIGLKGSLGERGFVSELTADGALSRASVTLEGFDIDLGALLPFELVGMPFGMSYRITDELNVPMPAEVRQHANQFRAVLRQMRLVEKALATADAAAARLAERAAQAPGLAEFIDEQALAEAALAAALADVDGAAAAVADAEAALAAATAAVLAAQQAVPSAEAALAQADAALVQAQADVAAAAGVLAQTQAELDALVQQAAADPLQAPLLAGDIAAKQAQVAQAQADLAAAQLAEVNAQSAQDAAEAALVDAEAAVVQAELEETVARAGRDASRAALNAVQAAADAARDRLATAQLAYETAVTAKGQADQEIESLRADAQALKARLAVMFVELRGLLEAMPDLLGLQESLMEALEATPVLKVGALHLTGEAEADATGSRTFSDCRLSGIEVLGQPVPTMTCADLAGVREQIEGRIEEFLTLLAGRPVDGVRIDGPVATPVTSEVPDADGFHRARVAFTPLRVSIPMVDIAMTWDATHARLMELSGMLLAREDLWTMPEFSDVPAVPLHEVPMVSLGTAKGGRVRVQSAERMSVASADRMRIMDGPAPLATELQRMHEQAAANPPGSPVQGDTPSVEAELGGLDNEAAFRPATAGTGGCVDCPGGGGGGGCPSCPGGGGNTGGGNTGGGLGVPTSTEPVGGGGGTGGTDPSRGADGRDDVDGGGGPADGTGPADGADGAGGGTAGGNGSDGYPLPLPGTELPHTGGGASAAMAGAVLLVLAAVLRRRR